MRPAHVLKASTELQSEFIKELSAKASLNVFLTKLVEKTAELLNASACSVFKIDAGHRRATQIAGSGYQKKFNGLNDVKVVPPSAVPERPKSGQELGLTGWILSTGKPFLAESPEEVTSHPHHGGRQQLPGEEVRLQCFLGVPIRGLHGEVTGVIKVERRLPSGRSKKQVDVKPFSADDELALESVARVASRCVIYMEMAQSEKESEAVTAWAREVIAEVAAIEGGLDSFLDIAASVTAAAMHADSCGIFLKDEGGKTLTQRAGMGSQALRKVIRAYTWPDEALIKECRNSTDCSPPHCLNPHPAANERVGLTAWIAATGKSFHARNFEELKAHCHHRGEYDDVNFPQQEGTVCGAFLGAPLQVGGATIGVIKVENRTRIGIPDPRTFSDIEQWRFQLLAQDIALAIKRLQAQIPDRYKIIEKAQETILKILRGGLNIQDLVKTVVTETRALFNAGACALFLKEGNELVQERWAASGWAGRGPGAARKYKLCSKETIKEKPANHEKVGLTVWIAVTQQKFTARSNKELTMHPHHKGEFDQVNFDPPERCESFMGFPLLIKEGSETKLVGVLKVETKTRGEGEDKAFTYFNELDEHVFNLIANSAALAIQNARLRESRAREDAWKEFTAMAAHRVNSEAAEIGGALFYLRDYLAGATELRGAEQYLTTFSESLKRIDNLVKEFTQYAAPPALREERLNLNELCRVATQGQPNLRVTLRLVEVPVLWGDRERLLYCFKELVQNASKAMPNGGALMIETSSFDSGAGIRIEFKDSGPGVKPEYKEQIFEPGIRDREGGTGLGLAIVRRTIREHSGSVREVGTFGKGAHFIVDLPARVPEIGAPELVLIVEDKKGHREQMEKVVKWDAPSRRIMTAINEVDAAQLIAQNVFDLVITDINLKDAGGTETGGLKVLEAARQKSTATLVIVVTAHAGLEISSDGGSNAVTVLVENKAKELGCFALVPKTSNYIDELKTAIARAFELRGAAAAT